MPHLNIHSQLLAIRYEFYLILLSFIFIFELLYLCQMTCVEELLTDLLCTLATLLLLGFAAVKISQ